MIRFLGHVPLVTLPEGIDELPVSGGRFRAVPFDEWRSVDDAFPDREMQYRQSAPVFLEVEPPLPDASYGPGAAGQVDAFVDGADAGTRLLRTCHLAMLLATAVRLPPPEISVSYLVVDGADLPPDIAAVASSTQLRRIGPAERELVVHAAQHPMLQLDPPTAVAVAYVMALIDAVGTELSPMMEAIRRTTRPGFTALNEAAHLIAGVEAVLVARGEPLTASFARRFTVLVALSGDLGITLEQARRVYGLRSDVVHGRRVNLAEADRAAFLLGRHRIQTCAAAVHALQWQAANRGTSLADLRAALDAGYESPAALEELQSGWSRSDD